MAIKTNYNSNMGITLQDAYIRIDNLNYTKQIDGDAEFKYMVEVYKDQTAKDNKAVPVDHCNYLFTADLNSTDNLIVQAYADLKSKYPDSEDC